MVFGALETGGKLKAKVLTDVTGESLQGAVRNFVHPGSIMVSDDARGYHGVKNEYAHVVVNHSEANMSMGPSIPMGLKIFGHSLKGESFGFTTTFHTSIYSLM